MTVLARTLAEIPQIGDAAITLGVFDGVHLGHRHVAEATIAAARARASASVALIFDPHPAEVVRPGLSIPRLSRPDDVVRLMHAAGIDRPVLVRFDASVRDLSPASFLDTLAPAISIRAVVMSAGSSFGRDRAGTVDRVREIGQDRGFEAIEVAPLLDDGSPISSTRIRGALADGAIDVASRLLGHRPSLVGTVVHGDRRGHQLGFPTANLAFDYHAALPALGIYRGTVSVPLRDVGPGHPALVSVGVRPTFHDDGRVLVEVYLLDWDGDLYDAQLEVSLLDRLREERRFDGVDALVTQMRADEAEARRRFDADR